MLSYTSALILCTTDGIMAGSSRFVWEISGYRYKKYRSKKNLDALFGDFDGSGNCKSVDPII